MKTRHVKPKSIEEYIEGEPEEAQERLWELLDCLRKGAPGAEESIKWSMPAISRERILFTFGAHKKHISLYSTPAAFEPFAKELRAYRTSSSTLQFPLEKRIPAALIRKIAKRRMKDVVEKGAKWM
jgi:uncharacterized protein YdhG (YjbR/CyaY superfamily)